MENVYEWMDRQEKKTAELSMAAPPFVDSIKFKSTVLPESSV